ncbi:MAG: aminopeptidase [Hydrogenophaga sp.]|jgi:predicted aminopeptidase|uniref:aminopeptidase n=1 Tax=Hydrogenophaga sp. TaxID=1904254 RepID=UPI0027161F4A|nr:aminopeptidase [Hydrogenophaga sp.]MDO9504420.1 aminopeptidase [Hydrogenophaga sp.]MDP3205266.1 aminopeptidase [Hydrogenophaga sp.]MDP3627792.1 aminopeptidase [Hydrogenophaga sp.]
MSKLLTLALVALLGAGCASNTTGVGYYWQSVTGHLQLMQAARPVDAWLADDTAPITLKQRLENARRIRAFAVSELALPDNASYHRYADLKRRAAVYNVVAAPALSLTLETWCFPVAGCVGYRGYFSEADARAFADSLDKALEVAVYPVQAYSTLGWMNWAGGDPLLNTFITYPEGELARIIFHELAHQVVYVQNDTTFNESFATTVERLGGARWLARSSDQARADYATFDNRRRAFRALTRVTRERLKTIYEDAALPDSAKQQQKTVVMNDFRQQYATLKAGWQGYAGYDPFVARANNASFAAQAAYDEWVPAFEALFEREGRDFARFYDAVRSLGKRPKEERVAALRELAPSALITAGRDPH